MTGLGVLALPLAMAVRPELPEFQACLPARGRRSGIKLDLVA